MPRRPMYLKVMESLTEPATLMEIWRRAVVMFGNAEVKPTLQAIRSSMDRWIALGKVSKISEEGETRYWLTGRSMSARIRMEHRLLMLRAEVHDLERKLRFMPQVDPPSAPAQENGGDATV